MTSIINMHEDTMNRVIILQQIVDRTLTQMQAAEKLGLSERQVRRLVKKYRTFGWTGLEKRPKGGNNRISSAVKEVCLTHLLERYPDFGPSFAAEKLLEVHELEVSRETVRQWMIEAGLWKKKTRKRARIHQSRERRPCFGELIQIDGSHHDWFEGRAPKCCLLVMIDDATSAIMQMRFEPAETTLGYMSCIGDYIKQYGCPIAFYSDKHSIFRTSPEKCVDGAYSDTQLHRALKELNIELICAHSPQAKGRVERVNATLQDRLVKEMRLKGINSIEDANAFLEEYTQRHNQKFAVPAQENTNAHRPYTGTHDALERVLCRKENRKVSKNLEVAFDRNVYQIESVGGGHHLRHANVVVCQLPDGSSKILYKERELKYSVLKRETGPSEADRKELHNLLDGFVRQKYKQSMEANIEVTA